jgi:hypothetical protein
VSTSVLYMSTVARRLHRGPERRARQPGGDGFGRLHEWFVAPEGEFVRREFVRPSGPAGELFDEAFATGVVLAGRRTVEQVDHWSGDHHGRDVPIFVPSHPDRRDGIRLFDNPAAPRSGSSCSTAATRRPP